MTAKLTKQITHIPHTPGVYFFLNKRGTVIYIGKSGSLRSRVQSYFRSDFLRGRPEKLGMIEQIARIRWEETDSEISALISESILIKKYRPRFNVLLKDDKSYVMVGITKEEFPRVVTMHQIQADAYKKECNSSRVQIKIWLGPYTGVYALKQTLAFLRRIFPYCTCNKRHSRNSCLYADLGLCPRYCCEPAKVFASRPIAEQRTLQRDYAKNIRYVTAVLKGRKRAVLDELNRSMQRAAQSEHYEYAGQLRDMVHRLEHVITHYRVLSQKNEDLTDGLRAAEPENDRASLTELKSWLALPANYAINRIEGYDIANIQGHAATGSMVVLTRNYRNELAPDRAQYRHFRIRMAQEPNDIGMLREVLSRRLKNNRWPRPDLILVDGGIAQLNAAQDVLAQNDAVAKHGDNAEHTPSIPLVALAKRKEMLYATNRSTPRK